MNKFINRKFELDALQMRAGSGKPELFVIYGKRRVGKTELVKQCFKGQDFIYLLADKRNDKDLLLDFSKTLGEYFDDVGVRMTGLPDWVTFFKYLREKAGDKRLVIVVDEFPFLASANKAIPSLFQKGWDEHMSHSNIFLIIMGSSISMMEKGVLAYRSPLYGRRTGQLLLEPLRFSDSREFFPNMSIREQIETYSVLGGIPAYLLQFSLDKGLLQNIGDNMLRRDAFLYNEVEFVLREELREPRNYFSILKEMAFGRTSVNELSQAVGLDRNKLSRYLSILEGLRIITRDIPVTERHPHKSRKGVYAIGDNFFRFWFEFVFPHKDHIERDEPDFVISKIKERMNEFVGHTFEAICMDSLSELAKQHIAPFSFTRIGKWWEGEEEIDIVALNEDSKDILFAECKWRNEATSVDVLDNLVRKSRLVKWNNGERKEHFALFSRSGFTQACLAQCKEKGVLALDLDDLAKIRQ